MRGHQIHDKNTVLPDLIMWWQYIWPGSVPSRVQSMFYLNEANMNQNKNDFKHIPSALGLYIWTRRNPSQLSTTSNPTFIYVHVRDIATFPCVCTFLACVASGWHRSVGAVLAAPWVKNHVAQTGSPLTDSFWVIKLAHFWIQLVRNLVTFILVASFTIFAAIVSLITCMVHCYLGSAGRTLTKCLYPKYPTSGLICVAAVLAPEGCFFSWRKWYGRFKGAAADLMNANHPGSLYSVCIESRVHIRTIFADRLVSLYTFHAATTVTKPDSTVVPVTIV